ncbi:4-alpha-L-fucosyltransferase glycosyl transferase group 56 [Modicisalibacter muralis]|uniref:4-alpha-L-fucosyltransferase glycosyl transferase group 56 n=1 Tax=Modicisalibacter muralis TaxID=119000 RepID=A0A1G9M1A9_9GAMM|nr:TDP-N-acetylfucosamine:lipid II N-acetylfucosaminyltransferase [Halomonas muralis]SDL67707.1 4-alpha-L-fucosyltransferase glycosyl transferase group 56 [Halomonas muralis]
MRILHLTTSNKFFPMAYCSFERKFPGQNTIWIRGDVGSSEGVVKTEGGRVFNLFDIFCFFFRRHVKEYDLVILHSLDPAWFPVLIKLSRYAKIAWIGWGFDYYSYIKTGRREFLLDKTYSLFQASRKNAINNPIQAVKNFLSKVILSFFKNKSLPLIDSISTVIKEDYDLICGAGILKRVPPYLPWNYGTLEGDLVGSFIGQRVDGQKILLGNSADYTNNHIEAIDFLSMLDVSSDVVLPLSYGDLNYRDYVSSYATQKLGCRARILTDFIPIDEYISMLKSCGYAIMNHKRQQALGNIVIMLYLGARIFLRSENPVYTCLVRDGAILNTINDLSRNPGLLKKPLTDSEVRKNIAVLEMRWSEQAIDNKTLELVRYHVGQQRGYMAARVHCDT